MEYKISDKLAALKPSAIREIFKSLSDPTIISFAAGNPSPLSFPVADLAALSADIFANQSTAALQYSVTEGYPPFRAAIAKRMKEKFGIGRDFDETIITTGGNQAVELCCKVMCNEGDVVVCENPSFIGALNAFRSNGAKTVGVPLRNDGIDPEELDRVLASTPNAKMLYLIPTFQNPAGITSTLENRKRVYEVAKKYGILIFEDNPYGELRFAGEDVPTYKSFDEDGLVMYCSSFSKILSAGMRIGYACGPAPVIQKMVVAKQVEDVHTNIFFQMLCYRYMTERDLDAHIVDIRKIYGAKAGLMLGELDKHMPKCVKYTRPEGGLFLWCTLPGGVSSADFVKEALARKVAVVPGTAFNCDPAAPSDSFRLNYSTPSDEDIVRGVGILGDLAREMFGE
ncbi:MAG: PLP-dependent aminotransferase family protein [Clostridia bacterium]|nr:PLP-dependent aminotransferase family protein [Clostridia bacterium]MBR5367222.1 PLP-dependent aminotransferase family protein [Clostridia bacterium]